MTAWAPSVRTNTAQAAMAMQQHRYGSPGQVYTQRILVRHKNGQFEWKTLFLVCRPSRVVAIVDSDGRSYRDLDDFRAHNHLFTADSSCCVRAEGAPSRPSRRPPTWTRICRSV